MEGKKLVPKIRFRSFQNDGTWKQSRMKEVVDVYDGTHQTPRYTKSGVMFLSVENIHSLKSNKYISCEDFERDFKIFPEKGDVLMTRIGDIGTANVVESNGDKAYYVTLALLKKRELDPYFLKENIHSVSIKKELWHRTLHIAFPKKINMDEIGKVLINYPSNQEQLKIGAFFKVLDERIANQERKIAKVKALKAAYLTEMFPQEGETVPKRRFSGFGNNWSQLKLQEFTKLNQGLQIAIEKRYLYKTKKSMFYITNEFLNPNSKTKYYIETPPKNVIANQEDILITRTGNTGLIVTDVTGAFHNNFFKVIYDKNVVTKEYLYYLLNSLKVQNEILNRAGTSTIPDLNHNDFYTIPVNIPLIKEQQKIGAFFKNLDDQIATEEAKLDKLKQTKEAYLEEMFV